MEAILRGHEPFPALAVDRHWTLLRANGAVAPLLAGADEALLRSPVSVLRLGLHPRGLAPRIVNLSVWPCLHGRLRWRSAASARARPIRAAPDRRR